MLYSCLFDSYAQPNCLYIGGIQKERWLLAKLKFTEDVLYELIGGIRGKLTCIKVHVDWQRKQIKWSILWLGLVVFSSYSLEELYGKAADNKG